MKKLQIYKIQNNLNKKVYIGITNQGIRARFRKHVSDTFTRESDYILHKAIRKYGVKNFSIFLLEECTTIEELKEREKYYIVLFDSMNRDKGYNMTGGGDGTFGKLHSDYTKKLISERNKGRKSPKAVPIRITNLITGEQKEYSHKKEACIDNNWSAYYLHTMRAKAGKINKFVVKNIFQIEELPKKEYIFSKKELRATDFDIKAHMERIRVLSKKAIDKNKEQYYELQRAAKLDKTKIVQQLDLEGNLIKEYLGVREAINILQLDRSAIQHCLKGRNKTAYGFKWKFKEESL